MLTHSVILCTIQAELDSSLFVFPIEWRIGIWLFTFGLHPFIFLRINFISFKKKEDAQRNLPEDEQGKELERSV